MRRYLFGAGADHEGRGVPEWTATYTDEKETALFAPIRFVWNATRGSRLTPWRSPYLRWRMETYSGQWAEKLKLREVMQFLWESKWELLSFLGWTERVQKEARKRP